MFGLFKNINTKQLSGAELAEEGLKQIAIAIENKSISLQQGRVFDDIYVHADNPMGSQRITYVMFSPLIQNQVIARCTFVCERDFNGVLVFGVDWSVLNEYRGKRFGKTIATKAFAEFKSGIKGKLPNGFILEAIVDEGNEASKKIARSLIGNEEVIFNKDTGSNVYSFFTKFDV